MSCNVQLEHTDKGYKDTMIYIEPIALMQNENISQTSIIIFKMRVYFEIPMSTWVHTPKMQATPWQWPDKST